jgi:Zn-dependent protease
MSGSPILFGAAKPVPYNPYNFTNQKWGEAIVAAAGPASNIALAIIFAMVVRFTDALALSDTFIVLAVQVIILNIFLAFFNLVPIPPLDGSKILPRLLPYSARMGYDRFRAFLEQNAFLGFGLVIFFFVVFLAEPLYRVTQILTFWLIGA